MSTSNFVQVFCGCGHPQHYGFCGMGADSTVGVCKCDVTPPTLTFACTSCAALRAALAEKTEEGKRLERALSLANAPEKALLEALDNGEAFRALIDAANARVAELEKRATYEEYHHMAQTADAALARVAVLEHATEILRRDRDLAVAHDRQPYPTAHAYEVACLALNKHRARASELEKLIEDARVLVQKAEAEGWTSCEHEHDMLLPCVVELIALLCPWKPRDALTSEKGGRDGRDPGEVPK